MPAKRSAPELRRLGVAHEQDEVERFGEADMLVPERLGARPQSHAV